MLTSYIKIAWRNIKRYPGYSIQNIASLSVALAVAILAIVYVTKEFGYDKHYAHSERIFRLNTDMKIGDQEIHSAESSDVFGPILLESFPEIESYVRFFKLGEAFRIRKGDKYLKETNAVFADSALFEVFNLPMVEQLSTHTFSEPNTVIITKSIASKYFGDQKAVGQALELEDIGHSTQKNGRYQVVGVIEDFLKSSHFEFDFIFPMVNLEYSWGNNYAGANFHTYVLMGEGGDYHSINQHLKTVVQSRIFPVVSSQLGINQPWSSFGKAGNELSYSLFPVTDIHLYSHRDGELGSNGTIQTVYILIALTLFVLLMASVNYVNLATSRAISRMREVGLRKVLGSSRRSLVSQFLSESLTLVVMAAVLAFCMALSILPVLNTHFSIAIHSADLFQLPILLGILLLVIIIGVLSGAYPAFFLSSFKIASTIKGGESTHLMRGSSLRKYLVVGQLTIAIILVLGTFTVYKQLQYIQQVDVGYNKDQVLVINNVRALGDRVQTFKNILLNTSGTVSASLTGFIPVNASEMRGNYTKESSQSQSGIASIPIRTWWVDEYFLKTLDISIIEGNNFTEIAAENTMKVIVNEETVKVLGIENPIGKKIYTEGDRNYIISGVVKNFNYASLRDKVGPAVLLHSNENSEQYAAIRFSSEAHFSAVLAGINKAWISLHPEETMDYYFLDEAFNSQYQHDQLIHKVGLSIALIAVMIACIGLLGMISFAAERRKKEIGVRKVLGASVSSIISMLSKDFVALAVISWLIASPIAWWAMNNWLQDFAYRIDLEWWMFALSGIIAVSLALVTVSFQAFKAAGANPVDSLRDD